MSVPAILFGAACTLLMPPNGFVAETSDPTRMSKTVMILKVDAKDPLPIRTTFQQNPPTLEITFPDQRVISSLPERSTVAKGAIRTITAQYSKRGGEGAQAGRLLGSLEIGFAAPYAYRVWSEPSQVVVEIEHPSSVAGATMEVGLMGGTIIAGARTLMVSERFRAMQEALAKATASAIPVAPSPKTPELKPESFNVVLTGPSTVAGLSKTGLSERGAAQRPVSLSKSAPGSVDRSPWRRVPRAVPSSGWVIGLSLGLILIGTSWWLLSRQGGIGRWIPQTPSERKNTRLPSGVVLIDQLVWRAFERQGYQLVLEKELVQEPWGTLRVIVKDGAKMALLFVGHGPFFEKQTVERFIRNMREIGVDQGMLIASGSFTVPAQRLAKEHHVTLIGREQVVELLSAGAGSEYVVKQLEQHQARLEEAKETLRQYAEELDCLRRQRNEASWYLGEERAKSATLEAQLDELTRRVRHHEAELQRWQQDAATMRRQWEESEWYLGESRERARHLEEQLAALQELATRLAAAERSRDEATWHLGEERNRANALQTELARTQTQREETASRERFLQDTLTQLSHEVTALRVLGDRRRQPRVTVSNVFVELNEGKAEPLIASSLRNLSREGMRVATDHELPKALNVQLRFPNGESIRSKARVVWQRPEGEQPSRYESGCRLTGLSSSTKTRIGELVQASFTAS